MFAIKHVGVSVVCTVWSVVGTVSVTFIDIWCVQETVHAVKIASFILVIIGAIGVNLRQAQR